MRLFKMIWGYLALLCACLMRGAEGALNCQQPLPFRHYQEFANHMLSYPGQQTISSSTVDQCASNCDNFGSINCIAFNFDSDDLKCQLLKYTKGQVNSGQGIQYISNPNDKISYYESLCNSINDKAIYPDPNVKCTGGRIPVWTRYQGHTIVSPTQYKTTSAATVTACQTACMAEQICVSAAYSTTLLQCRMYSTRRRQAGVITGADNSFAFYEWDCNLTPPTGKCSSGLNVLWDVTPNNDLGGVLESTLVNTNLVDCRQACLNDATCKSIDHGTGNNECTLNQGTVQSGGTLTQTGLRDYFMWQCGHTTTPIVQKCPAGQKMYWDGWPDRSLAGSDTATKTGVTTFLDCNAACLAYTGCVSVEFSPTQQRCVLSNVKNSAAVTVDVGNNYMEWRCSAQPPSQCAAGLTLTWNEQKDTTLNGLDHVVVVGLNDLNACRTRCLSFADFVCKSIDFDDATRVCTLSMGKVGVGGATTVATAGKSYHDWACINANNKCPVGQVLVWEESKGEYLTGNDDVKLFSIANNDECARRCLVETSISCLSYDYNLGLQTCFLSKVKKAAGTVQADAAWNYYEYRCQNPSTPTTGICEAGQKVDWDDVAGKRLQLNDDKTLNGVADEKACQQLCLDEQTFGCKSVEYSSLAKQCVMSKKNTRDAVALVSDPNFTFSEWKCEDDHRRWPMGMDPMYITLIGFGTFLVLLLTAIVATICMLTRP